MAGEHQRRGHCHRGPATAAHCVCHGRRRRLARLRERLPAQRRGPVVGPPGRPERPALRQGLRRGQPHGPLRPPGAGAAVVGGPRQRTGRRAPRQGPAAGRARHRPAAARPARLGRVGRRRTADAVPRQRRRGHRPRALPGPVGRAPGQRGHVPLGRRPRHPAPLAAGRGRAAVGLPAGGQERPRAGPHGTRRGAGNGLTPIDFPGRGGGC
ncbi:hypothetical protein SBRY_20110 [Actinacidiphila bryophytorum]|uniref:Uncharacterized protein n=1 Tax=Actinacidiphila bryophytorum TaxID=1436133 RepID=A0A9W4E5D8_9ACTN|nr:hypothetical protein SBRY_20110 [Actinacidiphila bryophytorum]